MLWSTTSARSASRKSTSFPSSAFRSSPSERLPAFAARNIAASPFQNGGPQPRASSPRRGCSILTTSAPSAASSCVHHGPASEEERSTTSTPASGAKATAAIMSEVFDSLVDLVAATPWAYAAILAIAALDAVFPLVPSETTVIAAGVLAAAGELELPLVVAAGAAGALGGDSTSYAAGGRLGG